MQGTDIDNTIINRYRITQRFTRGGMAEIYLAEDLQTGQTVAVKVVRNSNADFFERFRREVKVIAELRHEHILPALDYGEHGEWCYMVTPYIEFGTLSMLLARNGPLTPEHAGEILGQLASALDFAHEHGVVHRDIKPSNVLMRDKHFAYLADFGLVKSVGAAHSLTQSGFLVGTPEYMAPELVEWPATPTSDTYALGIVLYQMLTGHVPFRGDSPVSIVWKHLQDLPEPPSKFNSNIPYHIEQVILSALEKDPRKRFQKPSDLYHAYQRALGLEKEPTRPELVAISAPAPVQVEIIPITPVVSISVWWQMLTDARKITLLVLCAMLTLIIILAGIALLGVH
jgi:serine/threonine protein kinase